MSSEKIKDQYSYAPSDDIAVLAPSGNLESGQSWQSFKKRLWLRLCERGPDLIADALLQALTSVIKSLPKLLLALFLIGCGMFLHRWNIVPDVLLRAWEQVKTFFS